MVVLLFCSGVQLWACLVPVVGQLGRALGRSLLSAWPAHIFLLLVLGLFYCFLIFQLLHGFLLYSVFVFFCFGLLFLSVLRHVFSTVEHSITAGVQFLHLLLFLLVPLSVSSAWLSTWLSEFMCDSGADSMMFSPSDIGSSCFELSSVLSLWVSSSASRMCLLATAPVRLGFVVVSISMGWIVCCSGSSLLLSLFSIVVLLMLLLDVVGGSWVVLKKWTVSPRYQYGDGFFPLAPTSRFVSFRSLGFAGQYPLWSVLCLSSLVRGLVFNLVVLISWSSSLFS